MMSRIPRHLRLPIAAMALVLTLFAVGAMPAAAHWDYEEQGEDVAITSPDHRSGSVCDNERDGRFVTADWYDSGGALIGTAEDGGDRQCSDVFLFAGTAATVRVCESTEFPDEPPNSRCSTGRV